jgi:hypothetical protein
VAGKKDETYLNIHEKEIASTNGYKIILLVLFFELSRVMCLSDQAVTSRQNISYR